MDRKFLMTAFGYAIVGIVLGIYMAMTKNHSQHVTHAHIMLVGFVVSFIYAACYKLWLPADTGGLGKAQYWGHQLSALGISIGLYILYGAHLPEPTIGPVLGIFSIIALISLILMKVLLIRATRV